MIPSRPCKLAFVFLGFFFLCCSFGCTNVSRHASLNPEEQTSGPATSRSSDPGPLLGEPTLNERRVRTFAAWISVSSILMSLDSGLSTQTKNRSDFWNATLCACLPQIERRNDQIYDDDVLKIWMADACMCRIVL